MNALACDVVTIGGGPGATPGAELLARSGRRVIVVEQGEGLGGTCLFQGCIPSKIYLETARRLRELGQAHRFGIVGTVAGRPDLAALRRRKADILAARVRGAHEAARRAGLTVLRGTADFLDPHELTVRLAGGEDARVTAKTVICAPGSRPAGLAIPGADLEGVWSSADALELREVPTSLVIVGGGYIACELATLYGTLGTRVRILEALPRLLSSEDPGVVEVLVGKWAEEELPVEVVVGARVERIASLGAHTWSVTYRDAAGEEAMVPAARVLLAVGRSPNTSGISFQRAGIELGPRGEVPVNDVFQTRVPHIYAPGDVNGRVMLAHAATRQSLVAARHILGQLTEPPPPAVVPHVIFTDPEIAAVGADSRDLATHPGWRLTRWPYAGDARARIVGDLTGFAQMVWDAGTGRVQGVQVVGYDAGELIAEATHAITHEETVGSIAQTIHAHPTMNEVISELAAAALSEGPQGAG